MKALLISGSVIANIVLAASLVLRPSLAPPTVRDFITEHVRSSDAATTKRAAKTPAVVAKAKPLWTRLETDDLTGLIARLRNAGFPPSVIRGIVSALVTARYADKIRELDRPDPNTPFWRGNVVIAGVTEARFLERSRLYREQSKVLRELLGTEAWGNGDEVNVEQRRRYGNLSAAKIDQVQRIEDDYRDMTDTIRAAMRGIQLPEDREKLALLAKEKRSDLLAVMTPEELADYEMRTSRLTESLRSRLTAFDANEAEFKAIYALYREASDKVSAVGGFRGMDQKTREEVQAQMSEQAKAALGDARFNELIKSVDSEDQTLTRLTEQQNLPASMTDQVMALRTHTVDESRRIAEDSSLAPPDKRAALKTLADTTRTQLTGLLGADATQVYTRSAQWLQMIGSGLAVSIQPGLPLITTDETGGVTYMSTGSQVRSIPLQRPTP